MNTDRSIKTRQDISTLVHVFHAKIMDDEMLGPIFNRHIATDRWPLHLERLTDFWETNLFAVPRFKVSPTAKHVNVGRHFIMALRAQVAIAV